MNNDLPSPFDSLHIPRGLVCEFFATFARFEFALKETGFIKADRWGVAQPNWDAFVEKVELDVSGEELARALALLLTNPPKVQDEKRSWNDVPLRGETDTKKVLHAIKRVRNNLFHGGKHTPELLAGRDEQLVCAALAILHACITQNTNIKSTYCQ